MAVKLNRAACKALRIESTGFLPQENPVITANTVIPTGQESGDFRVEKFSVFPLSLKWRDLSVPKATAPDGLYQAILVPTEHSRAKL